AASSFVVLYRVSTPFTKKRFLLFICMSSAFIIAVIFLPKIFSLVTLPLFQLALTAGGIVSIPFLMDMMFRFGTKFKLKERLLKVGK
ncbi:MAG: cation-translocating P-type ATPase, partial [Longicatena sp.]